MKNGKQSYIYRFVKKNKKNMGYEEQNYMSKIDKICGRLPFSPRFLENYYIVPKNKIQRTIDSFLGKMLDSPDADNHV